jgi:hypothetical protein
MPFVVLAIAGAMWHRHTAKHLPQTLPLLWGGAMLVSFVGWGSFVNHAVSRDRVADLGLRAIWGVAFTLFLGGILCSLHVATANVIIAHTLVGVALAGLFSAARRRVLPKRAWAVLVAAPGIAFMIAAGYVMACCYFYGNLARGGFNIPDDYVLYFSLAKKIVESGSMLEPYACRRLLSFGGQEYLHAMFIAVAPIRFIHGLDRGVFVLVCVGLVVGAFTGESTRARYAVPLGLSLLTLLWLPEVIQNSASLYTSIACLLGVWRTVRWGPVRPGRWAVDPRLACLLGLTVVACIVVRTTNLLPVATFLFLAWVFDCASSQGTLWDKTLGLTRAFAWLTAGSLVALAPWSVLLWQSGGTPFFPAFRGNLTAGFEHMHRAETMNEISSTLVASLLHEHALPTFVLLLVAAAMPVAGRGARDGLALAIGATCGFLGIAGIGAWFGQENLPRYFFGYFAATAIALAMSTRSALDRRDPRDMARLIVIAAAVAAQVIVGRDRARGVYTELVDNFNRTWTASAELLDGFAKVDGDADYKHIQSHMTAGESAVAAVATPFRFDYARNPIYSLDSPMGAMGPRPGFPSFKGPEALASYLIAHGIHYLVYTSFTGPYPDAFGKAHWKEHLGPKDLGYLRAEAPYQLDAMESIEALSLSRKIVDRVGSLTLLDLTAMAK